MDVSLPLSSSFPLSLKINKIIFKNEMILTKQTASPREHRKLEERTNGLSHGGSNIKEKWRYEPRTREGEVSEENQKWMVLRAR